MKPASISGWNPPLPPEAINQQARAFIDHAAAEHLPCSTVTRDYDGMFSHAFDQVFNDRSIQVKPVGPQAPNLNAFIERWIQSLQVEDLDHFIVFGQQHFDHIVSEYVAYYHECRPHQGIGNILLPRRNAESANAADHADGPVSPPLELSDVKCDGDSAGCSSTTTATLPSRLRSHKLNCQRAAGALGPCRGRDCDQIDRFRSLHQ